MKRSQGRHPRASIANASGPVESAVAAAKESAKEAGLRYVHDDSPGIRRRRSGSGFTYLDPKGHAVRDPATLARIKALAIPPAYRDVWICASANGHLQAVGRDDRGRKQYRYHERWRAVRDEDKFGRMMAFGAALPHIRRRVDQDLSLPGLPRPKVLATLVRLLETTFIRVGNEEYAKQNRSFGLTTLRDKHVEVEGSTIHFEFRGKSGVDHAIDLHDARLARIVKRCQDLPGEELFQYVDGDGGRHSIGSADVNEYLREISGEEFTAKDFRTWAGTVLAAMALRELQSAGGGKGSAEARGGAGREKGRDGRASATRLKKDVVQAVEAVAGRLGNTKAVCRKCYIHPAIIESYLDGTMGQTLARSLRRRAQKARKRLKDEPPDLRAEETAVLGLLEARLARAAKGTREAA